MLINLNVHVDAIICVRIIALLSILNNKTTNVEMGRQLECVEKDKSMLEGAFVKLKQELKDRNKRVSASSVLPLFDYHSLLLIDQWYET